MIYKNLQFDKLTYIIKKHAAMYAVALLPFIDSYCNVLYNTVVQSSPENN